MNSTFKKSINIKDKLEEDLTSDKIMTFSKE
jgi:hypothetical protein